jgi:hypothetical protein
MKKSLVGLIMFFVFAVTVPVAVEAQTCPTRSYRGKSYNGRTYARNNYGRANRRYANRRYANQYYANPGYIYTQQRRPSFYRRHRNLINIGALVGGRRGALIGTAIGAGSGALYTYGLNPKKRRYYRRY